MSDKESEAFEKWADSKGLFASPNGQRNAARQGWHARAALDPHHLPLDDLRKVRGTLEWIGENCSWRTENVGTFPVRSLDNHEKATRLLDAIIAGAASAVQASSENAVDQVAKFLARFAADTFEDSSRLAQDYSPEQGGFGSDNYKDAARRLLAEMRMPGVEVALRAGAVERVARAICECLGGDPDYTYDDSGVMRAKWEDCVPEAEAAIATIQELTGGTIQFPENLEPPTRQEV